jgi:hypothetical protein
MTVNHSMGAPMPTNDNGATNNGSATASSAALAENAKDWTLEQLGEYHLGFHLMM